MKIHLITYGDSKFEESKKRICKEAEDTCWFDTIVAYGPDDLSTDFKDKFSEILSLPRGGGYWIWKPFIINKILHEIDENDILVYLDAGCSIIRNGTQRFFEYIKMLNESDKGSLSFQLPWALEKEYTIKELFNYYNISMDSDIACSGQIMATIMFIKNNSNAKKMIASCLKCLEDNPLLFTDHYNNNGQESCFIENRHDQSVLSLNRKIHGSVIIQDETYHGNFKSEEALKYPLLATRLHC